jgi:hypothetical protein
LSALGRVQCAGGNSFGQLGNGSTTDQHVATTVPTLFDATAGRPSATQLQHDYLDIGSDGLKTLARLRNVTGERIAQNMAANPAVYRDARTCLSVLPQARARLQAAFRRLGDLYPEATFPPVTIAVGRGKPMGVGSPVTGVQIGLEPLCTTTWLNPDVEDRFVYVIAHEFVHVQQVPAMVDDPRPTVLEGALVEGAADFIGELTAGGVSYAYLAAMTTGREKDIETAFVRDLDSHDVSTWLYNSTADTPNDLGYWVGYRIVKAFYQRAADKRAAVRDILQMRDPRAFLAKSGWSPGMALP